MRLLLDTHVILWWLDDSKRLSAQARRWIENPENTIFISAASIWEIRIKQALGKVRLPNSFQQALEQSGFEMLTVNAAHAHAIGRLPPLHRDPFDRMLLAQATVEGLTLVTADDEVAAYGPPARRT